MPFEYYPFEPELMSSYTPIYYSRNQKNWNNPPSFKNETIIYSLSEPDRQLKAHKIIRGSNRRPFLCGGSGDISLCSYWSMKLLPIESSILVDIEHSFTMKKLM